MSVKYIYCDGHVQVISGKPLTGKYDKKLLRICKYAADGAINGNVYLYDMKERFSLKEQIICETQNMDGIFYPSLGSLEKLVKAFWGNSFTITKENNLVVIEEKR